MAPRVNGQQDLRPQSVSNQMSNPEDEIPACQSCRKKKAKCNREQPCSQCVRFKVNCLFDARRLKPGLRAGAMEHLQQRVETLENMFIGQGILWQQMWESLHPNTSLPSSTTEKDSDTVGSRKNQLKETFVQLAINKRQSTSTPSPASAVQNGDTDQAIPPLKRRKTEWATSPASDVLQDEGSPAGLPPNKVMDELIEFYFANIHHWIPILHVKQFRLLVQTTEGRQRAVYILHAIVATCIRFSTDSSLGDRAAKARMARLSRQRVVLCSMESFSVENLQALVIIAFDTIGSGRGPSSWSIVGSMTRTVEQLQLSVEEDNIDGSGRDKVGETLIRRMVFLKPSKSWSEAEERRRLFWTVFLMDRFCSVSTGWNISLTSADVKRRLPCEGALWEKEREVCAPYFGISDKSGIGHSQSVLTESRASSDPEDQDSIGGFAYSIEATESLALVTNFFLHHVVHVSDAQNVRIWLMKFKELDLRLVQWKLYLPPKWRDASVLNGDGVMDPNLTLAHITHNTAVILLHQAIAYPPRHWQSCPVRLPSSSSAETCMEAASEISKIGHQFLRCSSIITNPQFSFCLFIAGRMLLTHSDYHKAPIHAELDTLISSLLEISGRWAGPDSVAGDHRENLASGFANRLIQARNNCPTTLSSTGLDIRRTAYSESADEETPCEISSNDKASQVEDTFLDTTFAGASQSFEYPYGNNLLNSQTSPSLSLVFPPLPLSLQQPYQPPYGIAHSTVFSAHDAVTPSPPYLHDPHPASQYLGNQHDIDPGTQPMSVRNSICRPYSTGFSPGMYCEDTVPFLDMRLSPSRRISRYNGASIENGANGNDGGPTSRLDPDPS